MPINYEKKFIFIHIPKTAGTSIIYNLFKVPLTKDDVIDIKLLSLEYREKYLIGDDVENDFLRLQHYPLYKILDRKKNIDIQNFFKFAFVRNPFDRMVSSYYYY